jgi:hypothetical protein
MVGTFFTNQNQLKIGIFEDKSFVFEHDQSLVEENVKVMLIIK